MVTEKIEITKFTGWAENFSAWKRSFDALLTIKDLDYVLKEKVDKSKNKFAKDNSKVYAYILLSMNLQTVNMYERKDKLRIASLRAELDSLRLDEGDDAEPFITKILKIGQDLADAQGKPIDDEELISSLFMGLPPSYESWIAVKGLSKDNFANMTDELRALNRFKLEKSKKLGHDTIFRVEDKPTKPPAKNVGRKRTFKCYNCNKEGHIARNCPLPRRKPPKPQTTSKRENYDATMMTGEDIFSDTDDNDFDSLVNDILDSRGNEIATKNSYDEPEEAFVGDSDNLDWIVDSGATAHMCPDRTAFKNIEASPIRSVFVANGESTEVKGRGNIETIMTDTRGNKVTILLQDVLWIPAIERNLLSV